MSELGSAGAKALWYSLIIALVWDPYQVCSRWCRHWAVRLSSMSCQLDLFLHHVRKCGFGKFLLLEPGIQKFVLLKSGTLGFGIRNTAQRIRNPSNDWNPESKFQWQEPGTGDWNPESTAWDTESKTVSDSLTWRDCCVFLNSGWRLIALFVVGDEVDTVFGFSRRLLPGNKLMELCRGMESHFHDWIDYHVHFQYRY